MWILREVLEVEYDRQKDKGLCVSINTLYNYSIPFVSYKTPTHLTFPQQTFRARYAFLFNYFFIAFAFVMQFSLSLKWRALPCIHLRLLKSWCFYKVAHACDVLWSFERCFALLEDVMFKCTRGQIDKLKNA